MTTSASAASRGNAHECMRTMWVRCLAPTASQTISQTSMGSVAGELMRIAPKIGADLFVVGG
jgi:hypothetical protein